MLAPLDLPFPYITKEKRVCISKNIMIGTKAVKKVKTSRMSISRKETYHAPADPMMAQENLQIHKIITWRNCWALSWIISYANVRSSSVESADFTWGKWCLCQNTSRPALLLLLHTFPPGLIWVFCEQAPWCTPLDQGPHPSLFTCLNHFSLVNRSKVIMLFITNCRLVVLIFCHKSWPQITPLPQLCHCTTQGHVTFCIFNLFSKFSMS